MKKRALLFALATMFCLPLRAQEMGKEWEKISIYDIKNPAVLFGEDWALVAAGTQDNMNAMTIGWGQFGILWQRPIMTVYVAPERYTNEFLDKNEYFTVIGFPKTQKEALLYMGSHSGRDSDKIKEAGLNPEFTELGNPIFKEGNLAIECKIIYKEPFKPELMDNKAEDFYKNRGISPHVAYIGEVINVWQKKQD